MMESAELNSDGFNNKLNQFILQYAFKRIYDSLRILNFL